MRAETNELSTKSLIYRTQRLQKEDDRLYFPVFAGGVFPFTPLFLPFLLSSFCPSFSLSFLSHCTSIPSLPLSYIYMYPLYPPFSPYLYAPINPLPLSKVLALIFTFKYSLKGVCMCRYNMQIECVHCLPKSPIVWMGWSSGFSLP